MKRIVGFVLALLLSISLCGCFDGNTQSNVSSDVELIEVAIDNSSVVKEDSEVSEILIVEEESIVLKQDEISSAEGVNTPVQSENEDKGKVIVETPDIDEDVEIDTTPSMPEIEVVPEVNTPHTVLVEENYYQYQNLSEKDKEIYKTVSTAMKNTQNIVDVEEYGLNEEKAEEIFKKVMADHPQYFWVTRKFAYYNKKGSSDIKVILLYFTDGDVNDDFDSRLNLSTKADRSKISTMIIEFNNKVASILNNVPTNVTALEKEKILHDYLVKNLEYDYDSVNISREVLPNCYNAYGAALENLAVCEGYTKLFQYLCYNIGINANQVTGYSKGVSHMWNVVQIDGKWYHTDVTWDDCNENYIYYGYFNVPENEINKDHSISNEGLKLPNCNSTDASFETNYAMVITSENSAPSHYKEVIDRLNAGIDDYIIIYDAVGVNSSKYLSSQIFAPNCEVMKYIRSTGNKFSLSTNYSKIGNYCYLRKK